MCNFINGKRYNSIKNKLYNRLDSTNKFYNFPAKNIR